MSKEFMLKNIEKAQQEIDAKKHRKERQNASALSFYGADRMAE